MAALPAFAIRGFLISALARPRNLAAYGAPDIFDLAAAHAFGIARDHPFVDGNKRVSFVVTEVFLELNGYALMASDEDCFVKWMALADGSLTEADLAGWLRANGRSVR